MSEQPQATPQPEDHDALIIDDGVIEKIAAVVTRGIDGILDMKGSLMSGFASSFGGASKPSNRSSLTRLRAKCAAKSKT